MDYDRKRVAKSLQMNRKAAGFSSAKAFAEQFGINPNTYTTFEQGHSPLSCERAWQLADALKCSMDELVGRDWPPGGEYVDEDAANVHERYSALPEMNRKPIRDMLSLQENEIAEKEKTEPLLGDSGRSTRSA